MSSEAFGCREETDLAAAWAKAYLQMRRTPGREIAPFAVTVHSPAGVVLPDTLKHPMVIALDECLRSDGEEYHTVEMIACTIFPDRIWKLCAEDREEFYREAMLSLRVHELGADQEPRRHVLRPAVRVRAEP